MKASIIGILLVTGLFTAAHAQNRSFGTLPLAQKPGASAGFGQKLENEKYKIAREVYDKLVAARGDIRNPVPPFALRKDEKSVAYINYDPLEIVLEEKASAESMLAPAGHMMVMRRLRAHLTEDALAGHIAQLVHRR